MSFEQHRRPYQLTLLISRTLGLSKQELPMPPYAQLILGGIIGIVASLITTAVSHHYTRTSERRTLIRDKLEQAYQRSLEIEKAMIDFIHMISDSNPPTNEQPIPYPPIYELILLVRCYGPSSLQEAQAVEQAGDKLTTHCRTLILEARDAQPPLSEQKLLHDLVTHLPPFISTLERFRISLVKTIQTNI